jgi:hypothetical protein
VVGIYRCVLAGIPYSVRKRILNKETLHVNAAMSRLTRVPIHTRLQAVSAHLVWMIRLKRFRRLDVDDWERVGDHPNIGFLKLASRESCSISRTTHTCATKSRLPPYETTSYIYTTILSWSYKLKAVRVVKEETQDSVCPNPNPDIGSFEHQLVHLGLGRTFVQNGTSHLLSL